MRCDQPGCDTETPPEAKQPDLRTLFEQGWFIAKLSGDRCPAHFHTATTEPMRWSA
jgi:hypothetical protein